MSINTQESGLVFPEFTLVTPVIETVASHAAEINSDYRYGQLLNRKDLPKSKFLDRITATQVVIAALIGDLEPAVFDELGELHKLYMMQREAFSTTRRYDIYEGCAVSRSEHVHHVLGHEATRPFIML